MIAAAGILTIADYLSQIIDAACRARNLSGIVHGAPLSQRIEEKTVSAAGGIQVVAHDLPCLIGSVDHPVPPDVVDAICKSQDGAGVAVVAEEVGVALDSLVCVHDRAVVDVVVDA